MRTWSGKQLEREKKEPTYFIATRIVVGNVEPMRIQTALSAATFQKGKILTKSRTRTLNI